MVNPLALYRTEIRHQRTHPVPHQFTYRSYWWLVDVDHLEDVPALLRSVVRFRSRDYCGHPHAPIADNVRDFLSESGIDARNMTIEMLTTPRQLGYSFNPITVFYCRNKPQGPVDATIAEVHNTYGERYRYLLHPDAQDRSVTGKRMPVSPFFDMSGDYRIRAPAPDSRLQLTVRLNHDNEPPFIASVSGEQVPITARTVTASLLLGTGLLTSARIRRQGFSLWRKRLETHPCRRSEGALHG